VLPSLHSLVHCAARTEQICRTNTQGRRTNIDMYSIKQYCCSAKQYCYSTEQCRCGIKISQLKVWRRGHTGRSAPANTHSRRWPYARDRHGQPCLPMLTALRFHDLHGSPPGEVARGTPLCRRATEDVDGRRLQPRPARRRPCLVGGAELPACV
jgi:hypothetical protein